MKQYILPVTIAFAAGLLVERMFELTEKIPGVNQLPKA